MLIYFSQVDSIGLIFSFGSLMYIVLTPTLLPRLQKRLGVKAALLLTFLAWPCICCLVPIMRMAAADARWAMWIVLAMQVIVSTALTEH